MLAHTMLSPEDIEPGRFRPLKRSEFERLIDLDFFADEDRIELVRGVLVAMTPPSPPHASVTQRLTELLILALRDRATVRCQDAFPATDDSFVLPDVAVVARGRYFDRHPSAALLAIEVAFSSVRIDLGAKVGIYGEAGVPEYWVVNLPDDVIEVFTDPTAEGYASHRRVGRGERLRSSAFPDVEVAVDDFLPPRG